MSNEGLLLGSHRKAESMSRTGEWNTGSLRTVKPLPADEQAAADIPDGSDGSGAGRIARGNQSKAGLRGRLARRQEGCRAVRYRGTATLRHKQGLDCGHTEARPVRLYDRQEPLCAAHTRYRMEHREWRLRVPKRTV